MTDQIISTFALNQFIECIERLEQEKSGLSADIRDVYQEAKGNGYDPKIVRQIVKLRAKSKAEREEEDALLETYRNALGL